MTITAVTKNPDTMSMTITAEFSTSPARVWELWSDPRQLERWWGPPTYPATVTSHDLSPGGRVAYHMTGPAGDEAHGWWEIVEADAPHLLVLRDGFAHADGQPNLELPTTTMRVRIEAAGEERTRMSIESVFPDAEAMEKVLAMGMEEGITEAIGQIDAIIAEDLVRQAPR